MITYLAVYAKKIFSVIFSVAIIPILDVVLQVFVEFENATQRCSWVQVYDEGVKSLMVEDSIVWVSRSNSTGTTGASASSTPCPALVSAQTGITHDCLEFLTVAPVCFQTSSF